MLFRKRVDILVKLNHKKGREISTLNFSTLLASVDRNFLGPFGCLNQGQIWSRYTPFSSSDSGNPTNKEGGVVLPKWILEEDRRLVTLWIIVSTNPIIGAHQKLEGF